ncbi:pyrrolysine biosynthesis protein PylB [Methanolobus vulcani]|uniref:Pyrrolysine biosynthesis protein PylB n=1 Tax=Methanolobus vulcani TaxID=38026 RepID=A0A7Z7AXP7_9EURY|nr:methylornithine synthase PylB [Methanolobus vulcani]SDF92966.1 pyrrolysine biosynthesis protein PylB [Methanolobus vulcani]
MIKGINYWDPDIIAENIINGQKLTDNNLRELLYLTEEEDIEKLQYVARKVRDHYFGNKVFLYSFVYFSTHCKNNCAFCYYNKCNNIQRYRLNLEEIRSIARTIKNENIHMVDLTMGEDPYFHNNPEKFVDVVRAVKEETGLPIMISPGVIDDRTLSRLHESGANFLALYQETHDEDLYRKLRVGQSFDERNHAREFARTNGYCVEDGILTGVGNDIESTIISLRGMQKGQPDMVRVMTFVPQEGTPLELVSQESSLSELKIISVLRLMFPDKLIPASLDLEGIDGMVHRLNAGANVVTSIISADSSLEGVVNYDRELEERDRDSKSVIKRLRSMGMEPASQDEFNRIIEKQQVAPVRIPVAAI